LYQLLKFENFTSTLEAQPSTC